MYDTIIGTQKVRCGMSTKMGRPKTDNPLSVDLKVRIDAITNERLMKYCEEHNSVRAETVRKAIVEFLDKN